MRLATKRHATKSATIVFYLFDADESGGWKGISSDENSRRTKLLSEDMSLDQKHRGAVATLSEVSLTKSKPCAMANAESVLSKNWGWAISPIEGDEDLYYQMYGVIRRGALDTIFDDDSIPLNFVAARGELNASVRGRTPLAVATFRALSCATMGLTSARNP